MRVGPHGFGAAACSSATPVFRWSKREYSERIGTSERWNDVSLEAEGNLADR